jgi:hypothetical protein
VVPAPQRGADALATCGFNKSGRSAVLTCEDTGQTGALCNKSDVVRHGADMIAWFVSAWR